MATFNPYLNFSGNTEEAFDFYKSVLGGEFSKLIRFGDLPKSEEHPIPEAHLNKIMHIALPIGKGNFLMASDALLELMGCNLTLGDNFSISISAESKEEADQLFNGLSAGGKIEMPIGDSPWGTYFGMFADKFGIQWLVDFDPSENIEAELKA